jgi:hypothetical protein
LATWALLKVLQEDKFNGNADIIQNDSIEVASGGGTHKPF